MEGYYNYFVHKIATVCVYYGSLPIKLLPASRSYHFGAVCRKGNGAIAMALALFRDI